MIKIIRITLVVSGIAVIIIPILMIFLWNKYLETFQQTTLANNGCIPTEFQVREEADQKMLIVWKTQEECIGYVSLAETASATESGIKIFPFEGNVPTKKFTVYIPKRDVTQNNYFAVYSGGTYYGIEGSAIKLNK
jgi:hypothetical protein